MTEITGSIAWSDLLEDHFKKTAERAYGLSLIHKMAEARYSHLRSIVELPLIILQVINGAASVGSGSLFDDPKFASIGVGAVAILGAIISAIGSYFKWGARTEGHRISSIQYGRLHRWLVVNLGLPREERPPAVEILKFVRTEYDRLQEISPLVPPQIVVAFQTKYGKKYPGVALPSECNGLEAVAVNRGERAEIELVLSDKI